MRDRVRLNPGEELKLEGSRTKGPLGGTEIDTYSVINKAGEVVGSVVHSDHTAIKGFKRTQTLVQKDAEGSVLVDKRW